MFHANEQELLVDFPEHVALENIPFTAVNVSAQPYLVTQDIRAAQDDKGGLSADDNNPSTFRELIEGTERSLRRSRRNANRQVLVQGRRSSRVQSTRGGSSWVDVRRGLVPMRSTEFLRLLIFQKALPTCPQGKIAAKLMSQSYAPSYLLKSLVPGSS